MTAVADETYEVLTSDEISDPQVSAIRSARRFTAVVLGAIIAASIPYLWVLWDLWTGAANPLRINESTTVPGSVEYDAQARALLNGHFYLPANSIGFEAFIHNGRTYTYFGILPSIIRMPVLLFTHAFDGRLSAPSLLVAWIVTALFATLLIWRIRIVVRGDTPLGWTESVSYGVLIFSILAGSVLVSLASTPNAYVEDEAWGVALACGSLFALVGVVERPSRGRVMALGAFVLLTNLNRSTTGYAFILGTFLVAAWFALGRAGRERKRWGLAVFLAGFVALVAGCAIDLAKFDLLFGFPGSKQLLYRVYGFSHINHGKHFSLHFLPSTLQAYLAPWNLRMTPLFPYLTFPELTTNLIAHTRLFNRGSTSSVPASMPLLFGATVWGVITSFGLHRPMIVRSFRILYIAAAASAAAVLLYGSIYERFLGDFMPLLVLGSAVGMVDLWRRLGGNRRPLRIVVLALIGLLALFGFWANMGIAIAPQDDWTQTQADNYLRAQQTFSAITGHPLANDVIRANNVAGHAPIGQVLIVGQCEKFYVSDGEGSPFPYPALVWLPVEHAPHTPLCRGLIKSATNVSPSAQIVQPVNNETVSGSNVVLTSTTSGRSRASTVSFVLFGTPKPTVVGRATHSRSGWSATWDTRSTPDGTYALRVLVVDADGFEGVSQDTSITVHNPTATP